MLTDAYVFLHVCFESECGCFVLSELDGRTGMCLITEQTGIRALVTERLKHLVTDTM